MGSRVRVSIRTTVPLSSPAARILSSGLSASAEERVSVALQVTPTAAGWRTSADSR